MTSIAVVLLAILVAELAINGGFSPLKTLGQAASGSLVLIPGSA